MSEEELELFVIRLYLLQKPALVRQLVSQLRNGTPLVLPDNNGNFVSVNRVAEEDHDEGAA